jgi:hypothetical protein
MGARLLRLFDWWLVTERSIIDAARRHNEVIGFRAICGRLWLDSSIQFPMPRPFLLTFGQQLMRWAFKRVYTHQAVPKFLGIP